MADSKERTYKKLGIVGGLGPAATAHFFSRVVDLTDAACDQEHLDVCIVNVPRTPDRTAYILGQSQESFVPVVNTAAHQLEDMGCQVLCITCVNAHSLFDQVFSGITNAVPIHMPRAAAEEIAQAGKRRVGIMATSGTCKTGVLQQAMEEQGLEVRLPDQRHQDMVMSVIYDDIKAGRPADMRKFADVCGHLREQGCDAVVLGCTELSLISVPEDYAGMLVVDAMEVLAKRCIQACGARVRA